MRDDRLILSWFSVANYAAALNGHVVLLDAWVARGSHSGYVPTTPKELAALEPEYIFIGHGDFDHAADAAEVAARSGANIVGTEGHCESIREQAGDERIECVTPFPGDAPPGLRRDLDLIPGVEISAITHLHSAFERPEFQDGGRLPCPPIWDPMPTLQNPPSPNDLDHLFRHLSNPRGGNVLYQFRLGDFAFAWHDTTGKIREDAPQVVDALRALPQTDVHFGAVLAFGQVTNCFRSLGIYLEALRPTVYAATHHDNFTFLLGGSAEELEPYVREELARIPKSRRPKLLYSYDPKDYITPRLFTFDPAAPSWK